MSTSSVLAQPCPKRWEELSGDDRRRACADCGKDVLAVSELGLEEARAASKSGACLSFVELPGGLVRTREGWRLWRVAAVASALSACEGAPPLPAPTAPPAEGGHRLEVPVDPARAPAPLDPATVTDLKDLCYMEDPAAR